MHPPASPAGCSCRPADRSVVAVGPRCLIPRRAPPERNRRAVRTAANIEVRKPVYSGSNLKWQRYAPYLDGAFDRLDDAGT